LVDANPDVPRICGTKKHRDRKAQKSKNGFYIIGWGRLNYGHGGCSVAPLGLVGVFRLIPGADAARLQTGALLGLDEVKRFFLLQSRAAVLHRKRMG